MTDVEIIHDLEKCAISKCSECSRSKDDDLACSEKLLRDAVSIMKLQKNAIEACSESIAEFKEDNSRLRAAVRVSYTKQELVRAVNSIIESFAEDASCDECGGDEWGGKIDAIQGFIRLIGRENCAIAIGAVADYPLIQYRE